jgi:hypothetical protein
MPCDSSILATALRLRNLDFINAHQPASGVRLRAGNFARDSDFEKAAKAIASGSDYISRFAVTPPH